MIFQKIYNNLKSFFSKKIITDILLDEKDNNKKNDYENIFTIIPKDKIYVYGYIVTLLQEEIKKRGVDIKVDGVLGEKTLNHVRNFIYGPNNIITNKDLDFFNIKYNDILRIINLTSAFEGTGFSKVLAAYDAGIITFGLVGFTWHGGNLQSVMKEALNKYPDLFYEAFKNDRFNEWKSILNSSFSEQMKWAKNWSPKQYNMIEPTKSAFEKFGSYPEVKEIQINRAIDAYMKPALRWCKKYDLNELITLALTYDVYVQMGKHDRIPPKNVLNKSNELDYRKWAIDEAISQALPRFKNNVRQRKTFFTDFINTTRTILNEKELNDYQTDKSIVYGRKYDLICQGIFNRKYIE